MGKAPKEVKSDIPAEEVIATDPSHVLSMDPSTRLDWFQMALLQAATGKLKATVLFDTLCNPGFAATKKLKDSVLANLHLFSAKQQKTLKEAVKEAGKDKGTDATDQAGGDASRKTRRRSRSREEKKDKEAKRRSR